MEKSFIQIMSSIPLPYVLPLIFLGMYFARRPFQRILENFGRVIYNAMRLGAASVKLADSGCDSLEPSR